MMYRSIVFETTLHTGVYSEPCAFDQGKDECKLCEEEYDEETQEILDQFERLGYDAMDIYEEEFIQTSETRATRTFGVEFKNSGFAIVRIPNKDPLEFGELDELKREDSEKQI